MASIGILCVLVAALLLQSGIEVSPWLTHWGLIEPYTANINLELLNRTVTALVEDYVNTGIDFWVLHENSSVPYSFIHGVASGDPLLDSLIIWTRVTPDTEVDDSTLIPVSYKVSLDSDFQSVVKHGKTTTGSSIDFTVKLDIDGLEPNTTYFYQFYSTAGRFSTVGQTRTLPHLDQTDPLKLAVYSCANYAGGFYHAYRNPAMKGSVDFVIHLGDYIYEYANGEYTNGTHLGRDHLPENECHTLEDYRIRYGTYRLDEDLQLSHARFPWILVWDDHEVTDNSWLRGSVHTKGYEFLVRKDDATQAYFEWLPIRPQKNINKIWRGYRFGQLFTLNMLDTRHYSRDITDYYTNQEFIRSLKDYEDRTMLGYDQEKWLERQLMQNSTIWNLISSQCVVRDIDFSLPKTGGIGHPFEEFNQDAWDGYIANRNRLLSFINDNDIQNSVILSGDFHIAIVSELKLPQGEYLVETGEGTIIVEFTTSAVSSPSTFPRGLSTAEYDLMSEELVQENDLIWNDGYWRGYFELTLTMDQITADYYGVEVQSPASDEVAMAHFVIKKGERHIDRGSIVTYTGALNPRVIKD